MESGEINIYFYRLITFILDCGKANTDTGENLVFSGPIFFADTEKKPSPNYFFL